MEDISPNHQSTVRSEASSLLAYDSVVSSSTSVANGNAPSLTSMAYPRCRKFSIPVLVASVAIFTALVSHAATVYYYSSASSEAATPMLGKSKGGLISQAKSFANKQLDKELLKPSHASELFYTGDEESPILGEAGGNDTKPSPPPPEGCEATLMLFRHCEGGVAREHCGYMGYQRSQYLATLFGDGGKWPAPSYLFAMAAGERNNPLVQNWREIETVQPLADKMNMTIDQSFGFPEKNELESHIYSLLRSGDMCGKLAVMSWKHHDIPHFSHAMGCGPEEGCPMSFEEDDYDSVWQIKYSYHVEMHAPYVVENLKAKKKNNSWGKYPKWWVYGTVKSETFDPLQFSATMGVYNESSVAEEGNES